MADEAHVMNMLQHGLTVNNRLNCLTIADRARAVANNAQSLVKYMMEAANRWRRHAMSVNSEIYDVAMRIDPARIHALDERLINVVRMHDDFVARRIRIQDLHNAVVVAYADVGVGALARRRSHCSKGKGECKPPRSSQGQGGSRKRKSRKMHK